MIITTIVSMIMKEQNSEWISFHRYYFMFLIKYCFEFWFWEYLNFRVLSCLGLKCSICRNWDKDSSAHCLFGMWYKQGKVKELGEWDREEKKSIRNAAFSHLLLCKTGAQSHCSVFKISILSKAWNLILLSLNKGFT